MRLVRQPSGSSMCGQACIAMVAGVSLRKACEAVGHCNATDTRNLKGALRIFKVACGEKLVRINRNRPVFPRRCIVAVCKFGATRNGKRRAKYSHWMVSWDGVIYDPEDLWPKYYDVNTWVITSYLDLTVSPHG